MSLQQQLESIRKNLEARIPPAALDIMHQATDELIASGQEQRIAAVGSAFPHFELYNQDGSAVSDQGLLIDGPMVITFYRGLWCPYCNADLAYLGSIEQEVADAGATMLAISPQLATYSRQIRQKNQLRFPILTDNGNELAARLGLRFVLPAKLQQLYRDSFGIDLPSYHGESSWTLPMPARFVVDQLGVIRYAEASADYTQRPEPTAMLAVLAALN